MSQYGYNFYFQINGSELLTFPITPSELSIKSGSNNKVITLINEGDINLLKTPSLTEVEFEARFPMRKYPYSREPANFEFYLDKFNKLKADKKPFRFIVARTSFAGKNSWSTNLLVSLEDVEVKESADEGDDVIVSFKLREYREYGVKTLNVPNSVPETTSTSDQVRNNDGKGSEATTYTIQSGDCLWNIAKAYYGNGANWTAIYEANKAVIEAEAEKRRGKGKGSSNGHWIYPNVTLVIPNATTANATVQKLNNKKNQQSVDQNSTYYKKLTQMESKLDK